jgi:sulfur-oxidizing protein SoxB
MRLGGQLIDPTKTYKVAGWAPVSEAARDAGGPPIWDLVAGWLRDRKRVSPRVLNQPRIEGLGPNPGLAA